MHAVPCSHCLLDIQEASRDFPPGRRVPKAFSCNILLAGVDVCGARLLVRVNSARLYMRNFLVALCLVPLLAACGAKTTVVLVPDDDGRIGQVAVASPSGQTMLTGPDQYTEVSGSVSSVKLMDPGTQQRVFGAALAAAPQKPQSFLLYFKPESADLDPAAKGSLSEIAQVIQDMPYPHVSVIGHTDTMGDVRYNDKLSLARAESVRKLLEKGGISPGVLGVYAFGENDPLIPTGPNVPEPRNRRVEVFVR